MQRVKMIQDVGNSGRLALSCLALIACAVLLLPAVASAQEEVFDSGSLSDSAKSAYDKLLAIDLYALGGIGYGGETSEGELQLDILLADAGAIEAFKSLVRDATLEGALYGLLGLKAANCACYVEFTALTEKRVRSSEGDELRTQAGCLRLDAHRVEDKAYFFEKFFSIHVQNLGRQKRIWLQTINRNKKEDDR